ncbi:SusC/RagA family TonB-linked outer membrane protein, partial [Aureispira]|nr:SusC/RagA family TonB-linked outer membrane protein [Aureispira sp.]
QTGNAILSFYSRINYKFKDRYLFGITARADGSSRFSDNYRYGFFPSFSAGWIISEEKFIKNTKALNFLKLRASYGFTGNDNIGDFTRFGVYTTGVGYAGSLALYPSTLANTELRWEKAQMFDISVEYGLWNNRVSGSVTFFHKQSSDLLLPIQLPTSSGFSTITVNAGAVNNWGFEIMLNTYNVSTKNFKWKSNLNFSSIRNKVTDVAGLPPDAFESGQPGEGRVIKGYPIGQTFVVRYAGVQQDDGTITRYNTDGSVLTDASGNPVTVNIAAGEALYYDINGNYMAFGVDDNGTGSISTDDINRFTGSDFYDNRVPVGSPTPDFYAGISNTLSYKFFELDFLVNIAIGQTIYDDPAKNQIGNYNSFSQRHEILNTWTTENQSSVPALNASTIPVNSDRFLYDASFIRLRSLTLSFNLPKKLCKKINFSSFKIYVTGYNLLTWTPYPGWDPEVLRHVAQNSQQENISFSGPSWQTPQARIIMFGIKAEL